MKPLKIDAPVASRKALLRKAETIPGAWYGIRIAGLLLLLTGWKNDGRESPVWRESTSDRGLGSQSQQQGDRERHETIDLIEDSYT